MGHDTRKFVYLDNAATTLKPQKVIDAITKHYSSGVSNVHRGAHAWSDEATQAFESARLNVCRFVGSKRPSEIIFTRGTTESINLVANSYGNSFLKEGDEILLTEMEHHSNIVPWQLLAQQRGLTIKYIPVTSNAELDLAEMERLLTSKTKLVSVVYLSNALGTINPIPTIVSAARSVGAKVLVDAAQAAAALPIDVQALDCDFLAFSGHKVFGPTGVGVLYGKQAILESMPPYQGGGSMISNVYASYSDFLAPPQRFEAGTPPIGEVIGLSAAIEMICSIGFPTIAKREAELLMAAEELLAEIPRLKRWSRAPNRANIVSFTLEGTHPSDVGAILNQMGVAVRAGHHCCQPLMRRLGVPGTVRASFSIYNTLEDAKALASGIKKAAEMLL